jgi:hypothetical protein
MTAFTGTLARGVAVALVAALVAAGVPWLLYGIGLHAASGRPERPVEIAAPADQIVMWKRARGEGAPSVLKLSPYTYLSMLEDPGSDRPGMVVSFRIASNHLRNHRRYDGKTWWYLSSAALTIWLTRNWSVEELLSKAYEMHGDGSAGPIDEEALS